MIKLMFLLTTFRRFELERCTTSHFFLNQFAVSKLSYFFKIGQGFDEILPSEVDALLQGCCHNISKTYEKQKTPNFANNF